MQIALFLIIAIIDIGGAWVIAHNWIGWFGGDPSHIGILVTTIWFIGGGAFLALIVAQIFGLCNTIDFSDSTTKYT